MFFSKSTIGLLAFVLLATSESVVGRDRWLERDGRAVYLYPRRFGQEQPAVLQKLREACPGQVCGTLAGKAVTPLLAAQPECSQQDLADEIIDASRQFDAATQANMIEIAKEYRQAEKNTPPDFTANPPRLRNSVFCQKAPKNAELNGLVQAQDPANDPELFFDPAVGATVLRGSQTNTAPFGGVAAPAPAPGAGDEPVQEPPAVSLPAEAEPECPTAVVVTITVTGTNPAATNTEAITISVGVPAPTATDPVVTPPPPGADFGRCSVPEIEFGAGFDGRRETSFQPKDKTSFSQGSAQNINIITRAICDQLTNACGANQAAKDLCVTAQQAAASAVPEGTGIQADAFNAVFGIDTNFASATVIDDQGRVVDVPGVPASPALTSTSAQASASTSRTSQPTPTSSAPARNGAPQNQQGPTAVGNFGSCQVPQILFAQGLDGRRETAFRPSDLTSYNHDSAQNIGIITQFICDSLVNRCGADQQARDTCARASAAAAAAPPGTGEQADAFNAVFGIPTNFAIVAPVDNQGRTIGNVAQPQNNNGNGSNNNGGSTGTGGGSQPPQGNTGGNVQAFQGALGGVQAPAVTSLGDGRFQVQGNDTFNNIRNALVRSCDVQNNQCANAANASGNQNGFTVAACNSQQAQCISQANSTN